MTVIDWADVLSRITISGLLLFGIILMLTERLIPRGRLEDKEKELEAERSARAADRAAFEDRMRRLDETVSRLGDRVGHPVE